MMLPKFFIALMIVIIAQSAAALENLPAMSLVDLANENYRIVPVAPLPEAEVAELEQRYQQNHADTTAQNLLDRLCLSGCWQRQWMHFKIENPTNEPRRVVLSNQAPYFEQLIVPRDKNQRALIGGAGQGQGTLFSSMILTVPPGVHSYDIGLKSYFSWSHPALIAVDPFVFGNLVRNHFIFVMACLGASIVLSLLNVLSTIALRTVSFLVPLQVIVSYLALELTLVSGTDLLPPQLSRLFGQVWFVWIIWVVVMLVRLQLRYLPDLRTQAPKFFLVYYQLAAVVAAFAAVGCVLWPLAGGQTLLVLIGFNFCIQVVFGVLLRSKRKATESAYVASVLIISGVSALIFVTLRHGTILPFDVGKLRMLLGLGFVVIYSIQFNRRISRIRLANQTLRASLKGLVADIHIDRLLREGKDFDGTPRMQRATIMFVEVVGFSEAANLHSAELSFVALRKNLFDIRDAVLRYDGLIDKSLADGIICFFSDGYLGIGGVDHERRALMAARDIQRANVTKMLAKPHEIGTTIFPFRIGINTADIYIGSMGTQQRLDISLSGEGVIMAKRFEAACEPHKILVGQATYDAIGSNFPNYKNFQKRFVPVKHFQEVKEAYEYNAFADRPQLLHQIRQSVLQVRSEAQKSKRYDCDPSALTFNTSHGPMSVIDFSVGGFCLSSPRFLGNGVTFDMEIEPHFLMNDAALALLNPLRAEVTWGMHTEMEEFKIGVKLLGLNMTQKEYLLAHLKRHLLPNFENLQEIG